MKKTLILALAMVAAIAFTGCAGGTMFIPTGGISAEAGATKVSTQFKHTDWFGFTPVKPAQVSDAVKELAKKCPTDVVNGLYTVDSFNIGIADFQTYTLEGFCK